MNGSNSLRTIGNDINHLFNEVANDLDEMQQEITELKYENSRKEEMLNTIFEALKTYYAGND